MAALAKLSRPRLANVLGRERLFARLDECRQHAAVWISGPPGAGKTTLTASYLDARGLRALWYQVDAGDADPASFFYHLGLGAKQAGLSRKVHLPLLTPEYTADLSGFSRRYFRSLYQGLPPHCVVVFDNLQDAAADSPFGAVIRDALTELPPGTNAILVSRHEPLAAYARLRASQTLAEIGWDDLRLTAEEAAQIAASANCPQAAHGSALIERCGGWAAGLTLLLGDSRSHYSLSETPQSRQALFEYLAVELFDRLPLPTRHMLQRTALLPWVSVDMAKALSRNSDVASLLEGLRRNHLFTEQYAAPVVSYQYHSLLREFLADLIQRTHSPQAQRQLALESAQLLEAAGEAAAALPLYLRADDRGAALQLVLRQAPQLAAQGRLQTLAEWISLLPAGTVESTPWLAYWLGVCEFGPKLLVARGRWEAAFDRFRDAADTLGQAVTAAGIIESHNIEFRNFTLLDPWVDRLQRLLEAAPAFPDPGVELSVFGSLLGALVMRKPQRELLAPYVGKVRSLLDTARDINSRVGGASRLLHYYVFLQETYEGEQLIAQFRPHLNDPRLAPHTLCKWLNFQALFFQLCRYDAREADEATQAALDLVEQHGLHTWATLLRARAAMRRLEAADIDGAAACLGPAVPAVEGMRFDMAWHQGMHSWLALLRGDHQAAVRCAQRLVNETASAGASHLFGMALMLHANALAAAGELAGALECMRLSRNRDIFRNRTAEYSAAVIEADIHLACGDTEAAMLALRHAFEIGSQDQVFNALQWLAPQMSRLCAFALEHDIETPYATRLIRLRGLRPPSPDTQDWPWPIKLHTLGRFEIVRDGEVLQVEGKTQRKPMALLKALVALGGADVPEDKLIDIVWSEALEGDGQKAFDVTVHRLRKLLGHDNALRVSERRVSLNRDIVWVDLFVLERELAVVMPVERATVPDAAQFERAAPVVLDLYRGHFLDGEADTAWLLPVRNRLNGRFQRFVMRLGDHWETTREWARAAQLYERAVELDPLAENFYARWMICLREQGRRTEAIEVFRRCRQMLSLTLGVKPAQATEAVFQGLRPAG